MRSLLHALPVLVAAVLFNCARSRSSATQAAFAPVGYTITADTKEILDHLSIVYLDDGQGGMAKTIRIEGVNVQVVNGLGAKTTNGVGNLIVVIVGDRYNETTANDLGLLAGTNDVCVGDSRGGGSFCAVVGGEGNSTPAARAATVSGGLNPVAGGDHDWVAGGLFQED